MKKTFLLIIFICACTLVHAQNKLKELRENNEGWVITTSDNTVMLRQFGKDMLEVVYLPTINTKIDTSHAVIMSSQTAARKTEKTEKGYRLRSGNLIIDLSDDPFCITFSRNKKQLITDKGSFFDAGNQGIRFNIEETEKIYGTGERAVSLNRKGYRVPLYNRASYGYQMGETTLNYGVPMISSDKQYAILYDNPQKGYIDIGKTDSRTLEFGTIGGTTRYYFMTGNDWPEIMKNYTTLTGKQEIPPRWVLGNLMSRMAYRNQTETDSILNLMLKKDFPVDAVIIDFYWFGDDILGYLGRLDWNRPAWPDPEKMIADFKNKGVKTILITEPYIIDTLTNYSDAVKKDILVKDSLGKVYLDTLFFFGRASLIDIFKPEAQNWFWEKYDKQIKKGVASWWGDLGEPESHPSDIRHINGTADEVHNIYGHYWAGMLYEKYKQHYPEQRLFSLMRAGYAGTQRYNIFPWTGDVGRTWSSLEAQLPLLLTMSMNGLGYIHSDAGGFAVTDHRDDELYTRWLQFACFTPILRPHGSYMESEPVYFNEQTQDIVRKYMKTRYRLLPYIYSVAHENSETGAPLMRPLYYHHPNDTVAKEIYDSYYWGPNIVVAPVYKANETIRRVYLPEGNWLLATAGSGKEKTYTGNNWYDIDIDLENIPIFYRFGGFIPMLSKDIATTEEYSSDAYSILYLPSETETTFIQYEDDGKTNLPIEDRNAERITYTGKKESDHIRIMLHSDSGSKKERTMKFTVKAKAEQVLVNNRPVKIDQQNDHNETTFTFTWNGEKTIIKVKSKR